MKTQKEIEIKEKKLNKLEAQRQILHFLYSNINKKFAVWQIWEELAGKYNITYQNVQKNIQWLQYQVDSDIKTERKGYNKLVWIEAGKK